MARPKKSTKQEELSTKPSAVLQAGFGTVNPMPVSKQEKVIEIINVYAVRYQFWHPFQKRMIPVNDPVPVVKDNWLKCQMNAGHIKELK